MREFSLSRRRVLGGAALLAAPAIIRPARAAEQCVVGTWGGDYARLLRENIDDPILKPAGIDVVQDIGDEVPRTSKMYAQKKLPHGTMDIACLGALWGYRVNEAGLVEALDEKTVPNLKHVDTGTAHAGLRAAHLQRTGAGVQPGHRQGAAAVDGRSARSEMEGQGRRGLHRRVMGAAGGEPARERHHDRLRQGQGVRDEAERQRPAAVSRDRQPRPSLQVGRDRCRHDLAGAQLHVAQRRLPGRWTFSEGRRRSLRVRHGHAEERAGQGRPPANT